MIQVLKMLTGTVLVTLLMVTGAGNLSSLFPNISQDLISVAKVFALYTTLVLGLGLRILSMILPEHMMSMGLAFRTSLSFRLQTLSKLAELTVAVAVYRLLPYLTGTSWSDGDDRPLVTFIALVLGLCVLFVILFERMAMNTWLALRHSLSFRLHMLSKLAELAMAVAVYRLLPYLTGISWGEGDERLLAIFIALALVPCALSVILHDRRALNVGLAFRHDLSFRLRVLSKLGELAAAFAVYRHLPYLTSISSGDGHGCLLATFTAIALTFWWLPVLQPGRAWLTEAVEMPASRGEVHGRRNRVLERFVNIALTSIVISASYILPSLAGNTSDVGHGFVSFALFTKFVLASGLLMVIVILVDVPGAMPAARTAVMAVTMMLLIDMVMVGVRIASGA